MKAYFAMGLAMAYPTLEIKENGKDKTLYIISPPWFSSKGGNDLSVPYGGRAYLSTKN